MKYFLFLIPTLFLLAAPDVFAQTPVYKPLVGIPGVETGPNFDFNKYITALYALSISIAALLAVIKIVIGGVKWMMTDIVTSKADAKNDIRGALIGLLIVLGAVLILTVINPNLVNIDVSLERRGSSKIVVTSDPNAIPAGSTSYACTETTGSKSCRGCAPKIVYDCGSQIDQCKADTVAAFVSLTDNEQTVICTPPSGSYDIPCLSNRNGCSGAIASCIGEGNNPLKSGTTVTCYYK